MKYLFLLSLSILFSSCANDGDFELNGKMRTFKSYGWMCPELKNDSIEYSINAPNIVLSIVFCETVVAPILLTGLELKEPVRVKPQYDTNKK